MTRAVHHRLEGIVRLRVSGPDAAAFLQGQFTNELRRPQPQACTYGLWLNQKGRVLADSFILARGGEHFEVVSLTSPLATIRERLEAYIIADDVTVEDASAGSAGRGWLLAGESADEALAQLKLPAPGVGEFALAGEAIVFRTRAAAGPNWLVLPAAGADSSALDDTRMQAVARSVTRADLARTRIEAGIPEIPTELGPGDLPQEGGLEAEAISFTKGCYLGQEVMSRLHNLGQVRRRLYVMRAGNELAPGAELFAGERRVGELRGAAPAEEHWVGLAMLQTAHVPVGAALARTAGGLGDVAVMRVAEGRAW